MKKATRDNAEGVRIGNLDATEMKAAVEVIVRGMRDNPVNVAALGEDATLREKRLRRLFGAMAAVETLGRDRDMPAARGPDGSILGVWDGAAGRVPAGTWATAPPRTRGKSHGPELHRDERRGWP